MTQIEMERQIACLTGESRRTVRNRGFSLLELPCPPPLVVDWDQLDTNRMGLLTDRQTSCPQIA